jgi:hypothetical protein
MPSRTFRKRHHISLALWLRSLGTAHYSPRELTILLAAKLREDNPEGFLEDRFLACAQGINTQGEPDVK